MTYEVRIVDENDEPCRRTPRARSSLRPKRPCAFIERLLPARRDDRRGVAQPLVPHRRPRRMDEDGFVLPRPDEGLDPPAWREHLVLGDRVDGQHPPCGAGVRRLRRPLRAVGVGGHGRRRPPAGRELAPEELLDFCQGKMAHFAIPRYVRFMDALPKNHAERVQKFELRDEGVTPRHLGSRGARLQGAAVTRHVRIERDVAVEMRDGVRLATDVYLPEGAGPVPDSRQPRARRPLVGVHRRRADAEPARGRRARVCGRDPGGARARRERGGVAPVRARARRRRGLPRLGPRPAMVRRSHRRLRHRVLCLDRALPLRHRPGRGEGARGPRHRRRHPRRLGVHERCVRARLERLLGVHDRGGDDQAPRRGRGDAQRAAARVRARDHRGACRRAHGCRSPITLCSTASARRSTASGSSTPTTTTTGRRSTSSR